MNRAKQNCQMICSQWILRPDGVCSLNSLYWSLAQMHRLICVFPRCTYRFISFVVPGPDCPSVAIGNENGQSYHKFKNRQLWAASWQNQQNGICAQWRLRSAWASAQSDQSSLCAQWVDKDSRFLHADSEGSDQTGQMPRLIWVFAGRTLILLVLSWGGSYV